MKEVLRKVFRPLLNYFEVGEAQYAYKRSHRVVLLVVGLLFTLLTLVIGAVGWQSEEVGALVPGIIFLSVGVTCLVVGSLGSDRAVAKIWGSRS